MSPTAFKKALNDIAISSDRKNQVLAIALQLTDDDRLQLMGELREMGEEDSRSTSKAGEALLSMEALVVEAEHKILSLEHHECHRGEQSESYEELKKIEAQLNTPSSAV